MAQHLLFSFPTPGADEEPDVPNVLVYFDDVTEVISAINGNGQQYNGPRLGDISTYYFCNGNTLNQFTLWRLPPYAKRIQTANSPVCIVVCDLVIENPLFIRPAAHGVSNGQVQIRAHSSASGFLYSLNNTTWQASPIFNNLAPGNYTAYVKDNRNCTAQQEFTVSEEPAFGIRFNTYYQDSLGAQTTINILKRDYTGDSEEIIPGSNPLVIRERGGDMFEPLRGQECSLAFVATQNEQFAELFTGDDREFRVDIYKGSNLFWRGWLVADVYTEPYLAPPFEVQFSATDGIGSLKDILLSDGLPEGFTTQWDLLWHILGKLNTYLPLRSGINIYETRMDMRPEDDPLQQAVVSLDAYHDEKKAWDCAAVLSAILKPYGAYIRQYYGSWHLARAEEMRFSYVRRFYDSNGDYDYVEVFDPATPITRANGVETDKLFWVERSQSMELRPGYREVEIYQDYGVRENLMPGGDFLEEDFNANGTSKYFTGANVALTSKFILDAKKPELAMWFKDARVIPDPNLSVQSQRIWVQAEAVPLGFFLKIEFRLIGDVHINATPAEFRFALHVNNKWLMRSADGSLSWEVLTKYISVPVTTVNNSWQTAEFTTPSIPEDGWLNLEIYSAMFAGDTTFFSNLYFGVQVKNIELVAVKPQSPYLAKEETYKAENAKKFFYKPEKVEMVHGDVIPLKNAPAMYKNLLMVRGTPSLDWQRRGIPEATPILELLADTMLALNSSPSKLITGALKGFFPWDSTIMDKIRKTRFLPTSFEYNDRKNTTSGEFIELLGTTIPAVAAATLEYAEQEFNELEYN